ncbi:HAD-IA family hydrolase [Methyloversatilis sp.]|uniref:HAD-IA family hydrolase n=1 Tax=Methyloversatilis sp. TaxID=2569862 RepID=UPI0035B35EB0
MSELQRALSRIHAIAFDLDGTLVDSAADIWHALNAGLSEARLPAIDLPTVRGWIGGGPDKLIARALDHLGRPGDGPLAARLRADFDRATLAAPLDRGMVYDGIDEMVEGLYALCPLVVVTNKPTPLARAVLGAAGLLPFMSAVHGGDRSELLKPSPTLLIEAAGRLAVQARQMLMVGDSEADLQAARAAGCPVALVGWGYGTAGGAHASAAGIAPCLLTRPGELLAAMSARFEEETG